MAPTVTTSYDGTLSRVVVAAGNLGTADTVLFEVSTDQLHWVPVRGGSAVPVVAGAATAYDYEFVTGVLNYYRASAVSPVAPAFVAVGTSATADNASVTPGLPTYAEGDALFCWASVRNTGAGSVVTPTGYTPVLQVDNVALFGRRAGPVGTEVAPVVAVAGGVTGADVIAQVASFRNTDPVSASTVYQKNPSATGITFPPSPGVQPSWAVVLYLGWRQSSWTSTAVVTGATAEIGSTTSSLGGGAGLVWDYRLTPKPIAVPTGSFVVTGGSAAVGYGAAVVLRQADYVTRATTSILPPMNNVWLKFMDVPYLNLIVILSDWTENQRAARAGVYSILDARAAQAYANVASPHTVTVTLYARSDAEAAALDLALSYGGVMLLHIPAACALKSLYCVVTGHHKFTRSAALSHVVAFEVPLTEVAPPDLSIVGGTVSWATLVTNYGSWADALGANATWTAVLARQGTPADAFVKS